MDMENFHHHFIDFIEINAVLVLVHGYGFYFSRKIYSLGRERESERGREKVHTGAGLLALCLNLSDHGSWNQVEMEACC